MSKQFNVAAFAEQHKQAIEATGRTLAQNFDIPAQRIINSMFEAIGEERFVAGDDRWGQIQAHLSGSEYVKPDKHRIARWSAA